MFLEQLIVFTIKNYISQIILPEEQEEKKKRKNKQTNKKLQILGITGNYFCQHECEAQPNIKGLNFLPFIKCVFEPDYKILLKEDYFFCDFLPTVHTGYFTVFTEKSSELSEHTSTT